ncbi:hypothetical protein SDRG_13156 [Saprolegnia diclina VS20]|uniref:Uncharacterized protein n=1 Tax=Saprolegnia diclina (strain VS20) TaxID=1156394 RepID=T0Q6N4_SAPDV|nr:hypothetical protein SDRG_13156 [Saprolegnia diclina VS20]EQC29125.1 hypothetical protein SDRG_13156 [Saprolegnia diclina VS20]|eukprot:XP_008617460.1 hypothetical protein SDRG_13156 [Saprolegnia diclina VS20]
MEPRPRSEHGPSPAASPKLSSRGRPATTPKLRVHKILSLPQKATTPPPETAPSDAPQVFFMTNLPASPPKPADASESCDDGEDASPSPSMNMAGVNAIEMLSAIAASKPSARSELDRAEPSCTSAADSDDASSIDGDAMPEVDNENDSEERAGAPNQNEGHEEPEADTDENPEATPPAAPLATPEVDGGGYYAQWRQQMASAEAARAALEADLRQYVDSLHAKADDTGETIVAFPDNYNDVVALMTSKDVQDTSATPWTRALLHDGLARTHAFGSIPGEDAPSELNMKIAKGIALIRKNDLILEGLNEKLHGSWSAKPFLSQPASAYREWPHMTLMLVDRKRTNVAQRIKDKVEAAKSYDATDFVARNKEMKLAGKHLTRNEEARVAQLLVDDAAPTDQPEPLRPAFAAPDEARLAALDATLETMLETRKADPNAVLHGAVVIPSAWAGGDERYKKDRLATIDATLQAFRDEENGVALDDDCISFRSGSSRQTSIYSLASTSASSRTVTKRQLHDITQSAKDEVTEKAPAAAIQQLLSSLSGITIEIRDDDDDDEATAPDELPPHGGTAPVQPHKPMHEIRPSLIGPRKSRVDVGPTVSSVAKASSAFAHLFTLPFEAQGHRKVVTSMHHR